MPGNRSIWKSDNQGVKEEPFIQTGRRGRNGQQGEEDSWEDSGWRQQLANQVVPHCMQLNREEQLGSERDRATQGSSAGK